MPNTTDLANEALGLIGQSFITNIDDPDTTSKLAKQFISTLRDAVLRDHTWNFAMARVQIAKLATDPISGFSYQYRKPDDCIRVIRINGDEKVKWKVEGQNILTDELTPIKIEYISRVENIALWDAIAFQAFAVWLASKLAGPLIHDYKLALQLYEKYLLIIQDAKAVDGQEGSQDQYEADDLLIVRSG